MSAPWVLEAGDLMLFGTHDARGATMVDVAASCRASLADLICAIGQAEALPDLPKLRLAGGRGPCRACLVNCCCDSVVFVDAPALASLPEVCLDPTFAELGVPVLVGPPCPLLHGKLCSVYESRALICRLFLCTPLSPLLEAVIYQSVGTLVALACDMLHLGRGRSAAVGAARGNARDALAALAHALDAKDVTELYRREVLAFASEWCFGGAPPRLGGPLSQRCDAPCSARGAASRADRYDIPLVHLVDGPTGDALFRMA